MKKFIAMLAGVVMASSLFAASAYAAGNVAFTTEDKNVNVGDTITFTIDSSAKNISTDGFNIAFDTTKFECVDILDDYDYSIKGEGDEAIFLSLQYKSGRNYVDLQYDCSDLELAASQGTVAFWVAQGAAVDFSAKAPFAKVVFKALEAVDNATFTLNENSAGGNGYNGVCDTITVNVAGASEPPAPTASVKIEAAKKTTDANWIAENGNTMFWGVKFENGGFNGSAVAKFFSDAKERELNIVQDGEINGDATFGVFVIVGDSTDAIGLTVTSGDVTATAAPVAYADAE